MCDYLKKCVRIIIFFKVVRFHFINVITLDTQSQYSSIIVVINFLQSISICLTFIYCFDKVWSTNLIFIDIKMTQYFDEFTINRKAVQKLRLKQNRNRARKISRTISSLNKHISFSDFHDLRLSQNHLLDVDVSFDIKKSMLELERPGFEKPEIEVLELNVTSMSTARQYRR